MHLYTNIQTHVCTAKGIFFLFDIERVIAAAAATAFHTLCILQLDAHIVSAFASFRNSENKHSGYF